MSLLSFILFASLSFSVNSQNVINKNTLKKQCSFNTIKNVEFVVSEYENNPSKFKYVYNYKNEIEDDENIVLYFNSDVCSFMCDKYKKIAFKDSENDYYKIKNIIVKNNDYNENLDNCVQLNDNVLIDYDMCLVDNNFIVSTTLLLLQLMVLLLLQLMVLLLLQLMVLLLLQLMVLLLLQLRVLLLLQLMVLLLLQLRVLLLLQLRVLLLLQLRVLLLF
jgi:hypothetical protein